MKFNWKKTSVVAFAAIMALSLTGCGGSKADDAKVSGNKVLKFGVVSFADNLEPTNHAIGWTLTRYGLGETIPQNSSGYSNAQYDALGDRYLGEFDESKRRQIIIDMQKILLDDAATIIYGHPQTNLVSSTTVANADIQACDFYWLTKDWQPAK